jgi:hypothetical protein
MNSALSTQPLALSGWPFQVGLAYTKIPRFRWQNLGMMGEVGISQA